MPNSDNYKYILQIKADLDSTDYYQKIGIASYSIPIDLTNILKIVKDKNNENNNHIITFFLGVSILIIIIIIIIFIIVYLKLKKKNENLIDKILSTSFSKDDKPDEILGKELEDINNLDSTFI